MGGSEAKCGAGGRTERRVEGEREAAGARHGRLTRGRRCSTPPEAGCPRSRGNRDHPQGPRAGAGLLRDERLSGLRGGEAAEVGGGPAASAALNLGVSARDTPSSGPRRCRHRQAVTSLEICRGVQPPSAGVGRGQQGRSSVAGPGNRLRLQHRSGTSPDPRGRHDGLRAAPQRGQAPPPAPPPATADARLSSTGTLLAPFSGTPPRLPVLVSPSARARPSTTFSK